MKLKKLIPISAVLVCASLTVAFDVMDNNGKAGRTGSPGESTCTGCHTGSPLNDGTGSVTISSPTLAPNWQYMPGDTYTINVTVARVGNSVFGLGCECLTTVTSPPNAGTFIMTTSQTQIKNATIQSVSRHNVVHTLNGGTGTTDSHVFTFKWVAPATNVGNVKFYVAGNAANGNNQSSGDHIYTTSQLVTPDPASGISEVEEDNFNLFPNPAHDQITVTCQAAPGDDIHIELFSADGKMSAVLFNGKGDGDKHDLQLTLPESLAPGIYFVRLLDGNNSSVRRIVVN